MEKAQTQALSTSLTLTRKTSLWSVFPTPYSFYVLPSYQSKAYEVVEIFFVVRGHVWSRSEWDCRRLDVASLPVRRSPVKAEPFCCESQTSAMAGHRRGSTDHTGRAVYPVVHMEQPASFTEGSHRQHSACSWRLCLLWAGFWWSRDYINYRAHKTLAFFGALLLWKAFTLFTLFFY